ncbi:hypothetical protein [Longitalea luteola]|uniref:hypothetical protein n=1 Tax=Longitalea luteola TaxID=2812563 RepID=UPI001A96D47A|nr:hypothetical protein [Longitalea luteola]
MRNRLLKFCGEVRRQTTTVEGIGLIAAVGFIKLTSKAFGNLLIYQSSTNEVTKAHTIDEIPVTIYHTTKNNFYYELFQRTGNEQHARKIEKRLRSKGPFNSEQSIYKEAKMPFIEPEMRENVAEWRLCKTTGQAG